MLACFWNKLVSIFIIRKFFQYNTHPSPIKSVFFLDSILVKLKTNEYTIDIKSCFVFIHNGTRRSGAKFVIAAPIKNILSSKSFMVIGNSPFKIQKSFIWAIAPSTCILAFAISDVFLQFFSLKKGGITNCNPFDINRSLILKLLSAIKLSPYFKVFKYMTILSDKSI